MAPSAALPPLLTHPYSSSQKKKKKAKTDSEKDSNSGNKGEGLSDKRSRIPCRYRKCYNPSCHYWRPPPVCQNYKSETGCIYGNRCCFRHVEADEKPNKKSKKGGAKGSVALLKESIQLGCVSQDSHPRKSILRKEGKLGSNHAVRFSRSTWHQKEKLGKKGSIARHYP